MAYCIRKSDCGRPSWKGEPDRKWARQQWKWKWWGGKRLDDFDFTVCFVGWSSVLCFQSRSKSDSGIYMIFFFFSVFLFLYMIYQILNSICSPEICSQRTCISWRSFWTWKVTMVSKWMKFLSLFGILWACGPLFTPCCCSLLVEGAFIFFI